MFNSIQYFNEECIKRFVDLRIELYKNPKDLAEFIKGISETVRALGRKVVEETLSDMDRIMCESQMRKQNWLIEHHDQKMLITTLGEISYKKTLFKSKTEVDEEGNSRMCYLLDKALGITPNQRLTDDAVANIYEEAVQTSYRKAGLSVCAETAVSKEAVMGLLHTTVFPPLKVPEKKKQARFLYVDADEDHYHLQFRNEKGDLEISDSGRKNNGAINKLIYVYEGIERESPDSKRYRLVGTHYFCRGTEQSNQELWEEVYSYIENTYDMDVLEKIYLNADGGGWIKEGAKMHAHTVMVLDEYHLNQALGKLIGSQDDSREEKIKELRKIIKQENKKEFQDYIDKLLKAAEDDVSKRRVEKEAKYILDNWSAAKLRLQHKENVVGSSTEGHVYHILSVRMSTDPLGWSLLGGSQMARLREYYKNKGDMLALARYQRTVAKKAAGAEELEVVADQIVESEKRYRTSSEKEYGKYSECMTTTVPESLKELMRKYEDDYYIRTWY